MRVRGAGAGAREVTWIVLLMADRLGVRADRLGFMADRLGASRA